MCVCCALGYYDPKKLLEWIRNAYKEAMEVKLPQALKGSVEAAVDFSCIIMCCLFYGYLPGKSELLCALRIMARLLSKAQPDYQAT